jgi:trimeric autotransporter adhesin
MRAVHRSIAIAFAAVAGFALLSCGGDSTGTGNGAGKVIITPSNDSIAIGASVTLSAKVVNAQGQVVPGATIFWNTSNANIATVSSNGTVTSVDTGTVQIAASANGVSGIATVTVLPKPVAGVVVTPPSQVIKVGQKFQFQAQPVDADGNPLSGRVITWSSSDATIASVDNTGLVTGVAVGPATITATSENKSGSAAVSVGAQTATTITVAPPSVSITVGQTSQLSATVKDASGAVIAGAPVSWSVDNPGVATVSSTGLVTGISAGSATVTAASGAAHIGVPVSVAPIPANAVVISPSSATLVPTEQVQLSAVVTDAQGNPLSGRTVTWSSNNTNVATVSASGNVTAIAPGSATITATSGTAHGTASITVKLVPVATVEVNPGAVSLFTGQTAQLTAIALDANGDTLDLTGRTVTWKSNKNGVASVNGTGLVTAGSVGAAVITATVDGSPGFASVTVQQVPVASVNVTPSLDTLVLGQAVQLTAQTLDSVGNPLAGRTIVWDTDNGNVAIVSSTGRVVSQGVGTANITATSEGKVGTATVVVIAVPVASVTVSPPSKTMTVGDTATFSATTKDAQGHVLTGRAIAWSSDNTAVATVDSTGLVTAVAAGSANITATSEGQTGSSAVTVNPVPVGSVIVKPQDTTMTVGDSAQFSAQTLDSKGNPLSGREVAWSTSDKKIAKVSATGVVQAVKASPSVMIRATSEGVDGSTSLMVTPPPPPPPPMDIGTSRAPALTVRRAALP